MCDMSGTEQGGLLVTRAAVLRVWVVVLLLSAALSALSCLLFGGYFGVLCAAGLPA